MLGGGVGDRDLVVPGQHAVAEPLEDLPDAHHPKGVQFGGTQGAHARRAQHVDARVIAQRISLCHTAGTDWK